ncbi:MAG: glycoside hydrolase family 11 protein [Chitinispirillaceae bacterium]|nr:glycoside hydrolase family 11 protein [Chitinispirillaceae bacterium]
MKSRHPAIHFRSISTLAMAFFFMNTINVYAQEEEEEEEITFPHVINNENEIGPMPNGYDYELWKQSPGTVKMTVYNDEAKFKVEWSNINNFVARVGLKFDETQTHQEIGTFTSDLAFQKSGVQGDGLAYYGIYGWTVDPLVEFYVMEDWDNWHPTAGQGDHVGKGTNNVDGAQYDVVTRQMVNQPSIKDIQSFPQVFSIRQQKRSSGHISISEHFKQWESKGIKLGKLYEVKIKVESYSGSNGSSGNCNVTKAAVLLNGEIPTRVSAPRLVSRDEYTLTRNSSTRGVYTLISLTGKQIGSMTFDPLKPAVFPTDNVAPGLYYLHFQRNGIAPVTRPLVVK